MYSGLKCQLSGDAPQSSWSSINDVNYSGGVCYYPNPDIHYNLVPVTRIVFWQNRWDNGCYQDNATEIWTWSGVFGKISDGTTLPRSCDRELDFETIRMGPTSERGKALSGESDVFDGHNCDDGRGRRFTNTAVSRFDGTGCWQRHLLIFQAIVKSNGWSPTTAALLTQL